MTDFISATHTHFPSSHHITTTLALDLHHPRFFYHLLLAHNQSHVYFCVTTTTRTKDNYNTATMPASVDDEASSKTDLVSAFNKIDVDGSGSVSKEVLWSRNGEQSSGVSKEDFDVLFEIIDRDVSVDNLFVFSFAHEALSALLALICDYWTEKRQC